MTGTLAIVALGLVGLGAVVGEGILGASYLQSLARQPEMESKLRTGLFMVIAFIEGSYFVTLAMAFVLK